MPKTIYLSPSTQEDNIGVGEYGTEEERMNQICDVVERHLLRHNITIYRNKPAMTLKQVVDASNEKNPDIHLAIHSNAAFGRNRGCEVYCHRFGGQGERLARLIYAELEPLTPTGDRGVKEGANHFGTGKPLYELAYTKAPAALAEVAFHDQPDDAKWIVGNIEPIGKALAKGILKYLNIAWTDDNSKLDEALATLIEAGLISTPQYWREKAVNGQFVNGEYAGLLILRMATYIQNSKERVI